MIHTIHTSVNVINYIINALALYGTSTLYLLLVFIRRYFIAGQGVYWFLLVLAASLFVAAVLIKYDLEKLLYVLGFFVD